MRQVGQLPRINWTVCITLGIYKKLHCVDCTVFGVWTEVSLFGEILLKRFKCGLQQKAVPDVVLVSKNNKWNNFFFVLVRFFFNFYHLKFASLLLTAQFCIWHIYRGIQERRSVFWEVIERKQIHMNFMFEFPCIISLYIYIYIYKERTWCNLAVCLLVTAILLYMFRTLFASIIRST